MHCKANLVPLIIFFRKTLFSSVRNHKFWTVLGNLIVSVAIYSKSATFEDFRKLQDFLPKNPTNFFKKTLFLNVLRILSLSVDFCSKFAIVIYSQKTKDFFKNTHVLLLWDKTICWTFWQIWLFQSHSTAILIPLKFLKSFNFFFRKGSYSLSKNKIFENFEFFQSFSLIQEQNCYF